MIDWSGFPTIQLTSAIELTRIHGAGRHPAFFNPSGGWRFGPPSGRRDKFGVCYLGFNEPLSAYIEKYGRFRVITPRQREDDALSTLSVTSPLAVADLTERSILGRFGITGAHSVGADYAASQQLASDLFDAGIGGIRYRIRHDPGMMLEAIALFGEAGEQPGRFGAAKTVNPIPDWLVEEGRAFGIVEAPPAPLP